MTRPPSVEKWDAAACVAKIGPSTFTANRDRTSASSTVPIGRMWNFPALLTRMSSRPNSLTAASTKAFLGRIADIRVDRLCLSAVTADALGQGFRVFLRRCIINSDRCSVCRKPLCDRRADSPRRSRNERDLSLKLLHGADPPWLLDDCVSQGPDPVFEPLCLHHHHLAVVDAERNSRHTLKGGEEMNREFS